MDEPLPQDAMRASDVDRQRAAQQIERAYSEGRLDLAEFDERTAQVWAARTYRELAVVMADLPGAEVAPSWATAQPPLPAAAVGQTQPPARRRRRGGTVMKVAVGTWLTVSMINFVVWGLVSITNFELVYPWWIWVAGPSGAVLLAAYLMGMGRPRRD